MSKKKIMEILTELPRDKRGRISWKETIGIIIEVYHEDYGNISFKIVDYYVIDKKSFITLNYGGYIYKEGIRTGNFLHGNIGSIMNITNSSRNTFHIDKDNILHIYGENKQGKWEALYSGNHIGKVMNSTWYVNKNKIETGSYNFKGNSKSLHHVDIKPKPYMVMDHISNEFNLIDKFYDNRITNLREVSIAENNRNRKCMNGYYYTGLIKDKKGWHSMFSNNRISICTKTKQDYNEAIIDNLIAQRHLGYKHQEEEFWKLDDLSEKRIKEVTNLLDIKIKKANDKIHVVKEYYHDIEQKENYYILKKNGHEMLFDCEFGFINDKNVYLNGVYWNIMYLENNKKILSRFHRYILGFKPNEYKGYNVHIDHLNNNPSDNRRENLIITTSYSNQCNKVGVGYRCIKSGSYYVQYMNNYKFWNLIKGSKERCFSTEQEAINEVNRRKSIIENSRVKLKSKQELDELIKYCLDNNYLRENGLADLDLGYLYWKGILKTTKTA